MCLGRISKKWASAALQYNTLPHFPESDLQWASLLVAGLWRFSSSIWHFRNEVVHGATVEEQAQRRLASLRAQSTQYYNTYLENPHIILPRH